MQDGGLPEMDPASAAAMQRWMDACTPNENHQKLAVMLGEWDSVMRMWMAPGAEPMESRGSAKVTWLVDGRWMRYESETAGIFGMPDTKHFGTFGYDNFKKKYVWSQVDSFGTNMLHGEGFLDQLGTALHLYGPMDEPMDGTNDKPVRYTWRFTSPDALLLEVHDLAIGERNTKVVEIAYTRKK
ncbi:MAG: DUF1579 family protein [Planctomycetota bacterium]